MLLALPLSSSRTFYWTALHDRQSQAVFAFRYSKDDRQSRFRRGCYPSSSGFQTCCRKRRTRPLFCILDVDLFSWWIFRYRFCDWHGKYTKRWENLQGVFFFTRFAPLVLFGTAEHCAGAQRNFAQSDDVRWQQKQSRETCDSQDTVRQELIFFRDC